MREISRKEKEELLTLLYWDMDVNSEHLYGLLYEQTKISGSVNRVNFYRRLLTTYDWYTLLKLIPAEKYDEVFSDVVIERLYPVELRDRFLYAREVLLG